MHAEVDLVVARQAQQTAYPVGEVVVINRRARAAAAGMAGTAERTGEDGAYTTER
nr:hypothetical protein [Micromonospora sp. WMMB482]